MRLTARSVCILLAGITTGTTLAADVTDIALSQALEASGSLLPRPTVGVDLAEQATLPFHLTVAYRCPDNAAQAELLVSVADTTLNEVLPARGAPRTLRIDVPTAQLEWLSKPAESCARTDRKRQPDEIGLSGNRYFRLHAGTTGYATLLCLGPDATVRSASTTTALDVWLSCPPAGSP